MPAVCSGLCNLSALHWAPAAFPLFDHSWHSVIAADQHHSDGPSFVGDGPCHAMAQSEMPLTESLQDTFHRILPLWHDSIAPAIRSGQKVLIVAHGNSIRVHTPLHCQHTMPCRVM